MQELKTIVMDLDGTLLTADQTILPYTKEILMQYQDAGISLVLSSGRDITSIMEIGKVLNMGEYEQNNYICLNGLEIYDTKGNLLHQEQKLQRKDAISLASIAKQYKIDMILFFKDCLYILEYGHTSMINEHFMTRQKYFVEHIEDIPEHYFDCLKKVAFIQAKEVMQEVLNQLQEDVKDQFDLSLVEVDWIEINPLGLNKGNALKTLSQIKNISLEHMIAFGNGENDSDMLKAAGKGIAMENSFDSVKNIADDVCGHCHEDGIAKYLLQHYPLTKAGN